MSCLSDGKESPRSKNTRRVQNREEISLRRLEEYNEMLLSEVKKLHQNCSSRKRKISETITISSTSSVSSPVSNFSQKKREKNKRRKIRIKNFHDKNVKSSRSSANCRDVERKECNHDCGVKKTFGDKLNNENFLDFVKIKKEEPLEVDSSNIKNENSGEDVILDKIVVITKIKHELDSSLYDEKKIEMSLDEGNPVIKIEKHQDGTDCREFPKKLLDDTKTPKKTLNTQNRKKQRKTFKNSGRSGKNRDTMHKNLLDEREKREKMLINCSGEVENHQRILENSIEKGETPKKTLKYSLEEGRYVKSFGNPANRSESRKVQGNPLNARENPLSTFESCLSEEKKQADMQKNLRDENPPEKKQAKRFEKLGYKAFKKTHENSLQTPETPVAVLENSLNTREKYAKLLANFSEEKLEKFLKNLASKEIPGNDSKNSLVDSTVAETALTNVQAEKYKHKEIPIKSLHKAKLGKTFKKSLDSEDKRQKRLKTSLDEGRNYEKTPKHCRKRKPKGKEALKKTPDEEKLERTLRKTKDPLKACQDEPPAKENIKSPDEAEKTQKTVENSLDLKKTQDESQIKENILEKSSKKSAEEEKKSEETLEKSPKNSPDEEKELRATLVSMYENFRQEWPKIIKNGLSEESKNEHVQKYHIKENDQFLKAPNLNPFLECSLSEKIMKSDQREISKQTKIASALLAIDGAFKTILNREKDLKEISETIKLLIDAGGILTDLHHSVGMKRRFDVIGAFDLGDVADHSPIENYLFSEQFLMILKSSELILKTEQDEGKKTEEKNEGKKTEEKNEGKTVEKKSEAKNDETTDTQKCADEKNSDDKTNPEKSAKEKANIEKKSEENTENSEKKENDEKDSMEKPSIEKNSVEKTNNEQKNSEDKNNDEKKSVDEKNDEKKSEDKNNDEKSDEKKSEDEKNDEKKSEDKNNDEKSDEKKSEDKNNDEKESEERMKNFEEKSSESVTKIPEVTITKEIIAVVKSKFDQMKVELFEKLKALRQEDSDIIFEKGTKAKKKIVNTPAPDESFPGIVEAIKRAHLARGWPEGAIDTVLNARTSSTLKQYERPIRFWWDYCKQNTNIDVYDTTAHDIVQFWVLHEHLIGTSGVLATWRAAMADFTNDDLGKDRFISNYVKGFQNYDTKREKKPKL